MPVGTLARMSGVPEPGLRRFLAGEAVLSPAVLQRLLGCLGYRLEPDGRVVRSQLSPEQRRAWAMHRQLAVRLSPQTLAEWAPAVRADLERQRARSKGGWETARLDRWRTLLSRRDLTGIRQACTGVDEEAVALREVSPLGRLLPPEERLRALQTVHARR